MLFPTVAASEQLQCSEFNQLISFTLLLHNGSTLKVDFEYPNPTYFLYLFHDSHIIHPVIRFGVVNV